MMGMALTLAELRDSWVKLSLVFGDVLTYTQSHQRDEVLVEVERYLTRHSEAATLLDLDCPEAGVHHCPLAANRPLAAGSPTGRLNQHLARQCFGQSKAALQTYRPTD
jgi:hypothetical protein